MGWAGERVGLWIDIKDAEPLLYLDGRPAQALDYNHQDVLLYDPAQGGEMHAFAVEAYAPSRGGAFEVRAADLVRVDRDAYALYFDMTVALEALEVLPDTGREYQGALLGLDAVVQALDYTESDPSEPPQGTHRDLRRPVRTEAFYASLPAARQALGREFFDRFPADPEREPALVLSGHAHIDVAWLWTLENTRKKCGRTFATALRLMEEYPEYVFTQSQPQLYAYTRDRYPDLYEGIKRRVAEGRWEPTGGMWVEPDVNVPSGESLIRQALFGNRFFRQEFGETTRCLWLPDTFGFPATLPGIMKGCGLDFFLTTKMAWNQFNKIPHDTFTWRGLDGSTVLAHFVKNINNPVTVGTASAEWREYKQKSVSDEVLVTYGFGDGGGGPTRAMIETGRRLRNLAGLPRAAFGTAEPFFERLAGRVTGSPRLPTWDGELYLEYHRGTYTSQARTKQANRKSEILYHNAEVFSALAMVELETEYPQDALNRGWESILLNQFHDVLPGSSIASVYEDAARDYARAGELGEGALNAALDAIAKQVDARRDSVVLFNPTDTVRPAEAARIVLPSDLGDVEFTDQNNAPLPAQAVGEADGQRTFLVSVPDVSPLGYQTLTVYPASGPPEGSTVRAEVGGTARLENDFVRVTFDAAGEIVSLVHKIEDEDSGEVTEREVIAPGATGNALVLFEDKPLNYDAWDIDIYYQSKPYPLREIGRVESIDVVENGPVRAGIEIKRRFLRSTMTQRVYLYAHTPRLEFATEIDWQERSMLLKAAFPVRVNANRATYEIQFGSVERPTHGNTSWEQARFEVCGHKWADLSEGDYGVSLLNDCKYGYDIQGNVLRLTLLKGAESPDPDADRGRHTFTYALLPHGGDWRMETVDEAYALNYPLLSRFVREPSGGTLPLTYKFATVDDTRVVLETIKKAEDGDGIVIRLYEAMNTRGTATLTLGFEIKEAFAVNLVEENPRPVAHTRNAITFEYQPFEIKTFLVTVRR